MTCLRQVEFVPSPAVSYQSKIIQLPASFMWFLSSLGLGMNCSKPQNFMFGWSEAFLICVDAVSSRTFDQLEDCGGPELLCRCGGWICSWPKHPYSWQVTETPRRCSVSLLNGKDLKENFSVRHKKAERFLSVPARDKHLSLRIEFFRLEWKADPQSTQIKKRKKKEMSSGNQGSRKAEYLT